MRLSNRAINIQPSATLKVVAAAKKLKTEGKRVYDFGAGMPDFVPPDKVKHAGIEAIEQNFNRYTESGGIPELRKAIIENYKKSYGVEYLLDEVCVSNGAKHTLANINMALLNDADEVIVPVPYWVSYPEQIKLAGGKPRFAVLPPEKGCCFSSKEILAEITSRTKAIIINSPCNPSGVIITEDVLSEIVEECLKKHIYIIYDECYEKFLYGDNKHITPLTVNKEAKKITLLVNSISKTYAMPGYRIGYALGPQEVIKAMANIQSQFTSSPSSISQKAALKALSMQDDFLKPIVKEYKEKRNMVVEALNDIKGVKCALPEGAFYVFPDVSSYLHNGKFSNTIELAEYLLNKANVAIVPGDAFGRPGFIRMCYATPRDIITGGLEAMKKCLEDIEK
jgi:aspartate aminotransferase